MEDAWVLGAMAMEDNVSVMRLALQLATLARKAGWDLDVGKHLSLLPFCRGEVQLCGSKLRVRLLPCCASPAPCMPSLLCGPAC